MVHIFRIELNDDDLKKRVFKNTEMDNLSFHFQHLISCLGGGHEGQTHTGGTK